MPTSRTSTTKWKHTRKRIIGEAKASGLTHCPLCGVRLDYDHAQQPDSAEVDHIITVAQGGTDDDENLQVICMDCNRRKGAGKQVPQPLAEGFPVDAEWLAEILPVTPTGRR